MSEGDTNALIEKFQALEEQARATASNGRTTTVIVGQLMWTEVIALETVVAQEATVTKYAKLIVRAVNGFSDYQECFWEAEHFLQLGIENMSPVVALECAKACSVMYQTNDVSDWLHEEWAKAAVRRCAELIALDATAAEVNEAATARVLDACSIIKVVSKSGEEYKEIIKANTDLAASVPQSVTRISVALQHPPMGKGQKDKLKRALDELKRLQAMCATEAADVITALESSVDLQHPSGDCLFEAYNAMCDQRPEDLVLQLRAAQGPLAQLAVQTLQTMTEGSQKKQNLFLESCVFVQLLLEPWSREDAAHMATKLQIATILRDMGVLNALLRQLTYWAVEWGGSFGDCGQPCFIALLELIRYFPEQVKEAIKTKPEVVELIHQQAEHRRAQDARQDVFKFARTYEDTGGAAVKIENMMQGHGEEGVVGAPAAE